MPAMSRLRRRPEDGEILRLAVPALGALVAEPLFLLADSAIVGHLGTPQLAGLAAAGAILGTLTYLCIFLAYGTTGAVGRRMGAGDARGAIAQGIDGMWLGVGIGVVLGVVGAALADPLVRLFGASAAAAPYAVTYLRVSSLGEPAMLLVLAATGVLRGLQNTRTPLVVAAIGAAVNVVLNYVLVYPLGMGIAGSALGTVIAQLGMAAAYATVVVRAARRHSAPLRPDLPGIKLAATSSVPLLIRTLALRLALLAGTVLAARYGTAALAAHQVAWALWSFLALAMDALAIAGQASISKLLGAGDVAGARAATRRSLEWGVVAGVLLGAIVLAARQWYIPLFTEDAAVRDLLGGVLVLVAAFQVLSGPVFVLDGILIGAGDGRYLAYAGLVTTAVYLAAAFTSHAANGGLIGLWWATGVFMFARLVALGLRIRTPSWMVVGVPGQRPGEPAAPGDPTV